MQELDDRLLRIQRKALADGARAEREGRRVIWIHGRPYVDPGDEAPPEPKREGRGDAR